MFYPENISKPFAWLYLKAKINCENKCFVISIAFQQVLQILGDRYEWLPSWSILLFIQDGNMHRETCEASSTISAIS